MATSSTIHPLSKVFIAIDTGLDFIPVASTVSNAAVLVSKIALSVLSCLIPPVYKALKDFAVVKHIQEKHGIACFLLMIPILNFVFALVYHSAKHANNEAPTRNNNTYYPQAHVSERSVDKEMTAFTAELHKEAKKVHAEIDEQQIEIEKSLQERAEEIQQDIERVQQEMQQLPEGSEDWNILNETLQSLLLMRESQEGLIEANRKMHQHVHRIGRHMGLPQEQ